jgi:formylglycine-generating enzyme required for sulfatase activity
MDEIKIFVSYRREDSRDKTDRICDHLAPHFGTENVFQDVDNQIPLGRDFRNVLSERVAQCDVFLAVIGDAWLSMTGPDGTRRLDEPGDYVRIEIEAALARDIPVIPILVGRNSVPRANELPESLQKLAYRQAIPVRPNPDFHHDMERLVRGIKSTVSAPPVPTSEKPPGAAPNQPPPPAKVERAPEPVPAAPPVATPEKPPEAALNQPPPPAKVERAAEPVPAAAPEVASKETTNSTGMKLVLIPAGEFLMGSPDSDPDAEADEKPRHRVRITRPFYIGATEVTQGQYQAVTGANPSHSKVSDDLPVENVTWFDAINFCNALSRREGLPPLYRVQRKTVEVLDRNGPGYRLPTEAEWEYACRAGSMTRYSFGDDAARRRDYAWFDGNSNDKTHPVGQKRPNAWGLYDMHGNVWEWCWDAYEAGYYKRSPGADPLCSSQAGSPVIRGGGRADNLLFCRSAVRGRNAPDARVITLGFRVARVGSGRRVRVETGA